LNSAVLEKLQLFLTAGGHLLKFGFYFNQFPTPEYKRSTTINFKIGGALRVVFHAAG
jgi:hypothetical protein